MKRSVETIMGRHTVQLEATLAAYMHRYGVTETARNLMRRRRQMVSGANDNARPMQPSAIDNAEAGPTDRSQ